MTRSDIAGCPGQFIRIRGRTAAICFGCQRYGITSAQQLKPAAHLTGPGGEWVCADRLGLVHVATLNQLANSGQPLEGGSSITQNIESAQ